METHTVIDENGNERQHASISRKIVNINLLVGLGTLLLSMLVCLISIFVIRDFVIENSRAFGIEPLEHPKTDVKQIIK